MRYGTAPILIHVVTTALLVSSAMWLMVWLRSGLFIAIIMTLVAVAVTASVSWSLHNRVLREQGRLISYIEDLAKPGRTVDKHDLPASVAPIERVVSSTFGTMRSMVEDVNARRREIDVQLRVADEQRRHAEAALNAIADGVIVTDSFNEIVLVNDAAARTLRFDCERALHRMIDEVLDDVRLVTLIKDTRESGDASLRRHVEHDIHNPETHRSAVYDVYLSCLTSTRHGLDETAGVVTVLRDITREKEIAETKSDFVANVSHELRTPITSIKAYMEMLLDGEARDETTRCEFYNIIQGETNRLSRLIDNILNISRIESGVTKAQREHIALGSLLHDAIGILQPQARAKGIDLLEAEESDGVQGFLQVFADRDMIHQALLNLIGNAIKYTPDGGRVTVSVARDRVTGKHHQGLEQRARVSVTDTGVGIPENDLPHLFSKFYRVSANKKMAKGTGLGLNLVKHIIETVHGGSVTVESLVGEGSTFSFSLPLAGMEEQAA